ncbi:MAG: glutathione S-transferase family protein [Woeseiaceae bacterium]
MSKIKLTYFDFNGGRGEPVRIALHAAGIKFEDDRLSFEEFTARREKLPFGALPVMEIDGVMVTQSNAMCRYAGKRAGLYPKDDLQAMYCDEVMGVVEDISHFIGPTIRMSGDEQKKAREALVAGRLTVGLKGMAGLLKRGGDKYFADNRLTVADIKAYFQTRWLTSGALDHVPKNLVQRLAPNLVEHQARIEKEPVVTAYYASRK